MGKLEAESSDQTLISHFSHPHPLQLLNLQVLGQILHCSACKLNASGSVYTCTNCNFVLHPKCYQLPQHINHPFDQNHALILQPKPVYPEGLFRCDACGNQGAGFSYHCSHCGIDLHTTCASLPMQLTHQCHHDQLSLTFSSPYPGNSFSCDICKRVSSKTWIYSCASCEFDVHLTCVATVIPGSLAQQPHMIGTRSFLPAQPSNNLINSPTMAAYNAPRPQPVVIGQAQNQVIGNPYPGMPQTNNMTYNNVNQPGYVAATPVNGLRDQLMVGVVNGIASGVAQSTTQAILLGFSGGGGGGGGGGCGDVSHADVLGMWGGGANVDGGSYYDGGYGGTDGGYSGGDGSY